MLKDTEFVYAVARVRSNENALLSSAKIESMITSSCYEDALKILFESGYENTGDDISEILSHRQKKAFSLIYESAPDKSCLDFLLVRNDFHNIKALIKCAVTNKSCDGLLMSPSVLEASLVASAIESKDFSTLGSPFDSIVKEAYGIVTSTMDGQLMEVYLDKMCLETMCAFAEKSGDDFSKEIACLVRDLTNIKITLRCLKTGKNRAFLESALCKSGDYERLLCAFDGGFDDFCSFVKSSGFVLLSQAAVSGYAAFEKVCDDIIMDRVKGAKYTSFGIAPLVAYYFAVDSEIKTVRIILSCKKNSVDENAIRERVRVLYV